MVDCTSHSTRDIATSRLPATTAAAIRRLEPSMKSTPAASRVFAIFCIVGFVGILGLGLLMPVLPKHAEDLGLSGRAIGLANGLFWAPAVLIRPLLGAGLDGLGRRPFVLAGLALIVAAGVVYSVADGMLALIAARLLHGTGHAFTSAALATMAADAAPPQRTHEAMSYFWLAAFGGYAAGPALGDWLFTTGRADVAFLGLAAVTAAMIPVIAAVAEPRARAAAPIRGRLVHPAALRPGLLLAFIALAAASAETFVPITMRERGLGSPAPFFAVFAVALLVSNVAAGKLADRGARRRVIVPASLCCALAMVLLVTGEGTAASLCAAALIGAGWGGIYPGVFALAIEGVPDDERGRAVCTLTAAGDLAFGVNLLIAGAIVDAAGVEAAFTTAAVLAAAGGVLALALGRAREPRSAARRGDAIAATAG
jgi:MFS family permease